MRPYPGATSTSLPEGKHVFNYRLCRGKRIVENAFGILAARWRIFQTVIGVNPEHACSIIKATTVLHNFLQSTSTPPQIASICTESEEVISRETFLALRKYGRKCPQEAEAVRQKLQQYFLTTGQVSWQLRVVRRGKDD